MRQEINLYRDEFRRRQDWLTLDGGARVLLALIGLLLLVTLVSGWQNRRLGAAIEEALQTQATLLERVEAVSDGMQQQAADPALAARVARMEEELQMKRAVLAFLDESEPGNGSGFSRYLMDLARAHDAGMRITGLSLTEGGSEAVIRGQVLAAEAVPAFLGRLALETSFRGTRFESVTIGPATEAEAALAFSAATRVEE